MKNGYTVSVVACTPVSNYLGSTFDVYAANVSEAVKTIINISKAPSSTATMNLGACTGTFTIWNDDRSVTMRIASCGKYIYD